MICCQAKKNPKKTLDFLIEKPYKFLNN